MEQFIAAHDPQLKSINFPMILADELYHKLNIDHVNDISDAFEIRTFENSRSMLFAKKDLHADSSLYIVDHVWTNDGGKQAYDKLKKSPELVERLASLFNISPHVDPEESLDLDKQVNVISTLCDSTKEAAEKALNDEESDTISALVKLSGENQGTVEETEPKKKKDKCTFDEFKSAMQSSGQISGNENEAYLETMYKNFLEGGDGCGNTSQYNWSDDGSTVTVFVSIPGTVKKQAIKSTLGIKSWKLSVNDTELINGELFASVKPDECYWAIESPGVLCMTLEKVVGENLWAELIKGEVLLSPDMIFSTSWLKERSSFLYLREILDAMWCYSQVYVFMSSNGVQKMPMWYIMDEYGSALTHGKEANFGCSPFFNINNNKTYSLIWPVRDVAKGDVCQRNFIPQIMSQENHTVYKARLKAFTGRKIHSYVDVTSSVEHQSGISEMKVIHLKNKNVVSADERQTQISIHASKYNNDVTVNMLSKFSRNVAISNEQHVDINLLTIDDTSIMVDGAALPTSEMIANTDYLQNYLKFKLGDFSGFAMSYILPRDLELFCKEYESTDLPSFWIVKEVDNRVLEVHTVITSSYSRIVRMCEPGSISVSKYITDQPRFRHHRFVLNYAVILSICDQTIFVYKKPLIRQARERSDPNALIHEYNTSSELTEMPEKLVGYQDAWTFEDFKTGMNKLLLPVNPDRGWDVYQDTIFQTIGMLSKAIIQDLVVNKQGKSFVTFGVDILIDSNLTPIIIDVNGVSNLPNPDSLQDVLEFVMGNFSNDFVQVME